MNHAAAPPESYARSPHIPVPQSGADFDAWLVPSPLVLGRQKIASKGGPSGAQSDL